MLQPPWKNSLAVPQKATHAFTIWSSDSTPGYIYINIVEKICSHTKNWMRALTGGI